MAELDYLMGGGQTQSGIDVPPAQGFQNRLEPPKTEEEKQQRISAWEKFLNEVQTNPSVQMGMIRMGTMMMQPRGPYQTVGGHIGQSLGAGVESMQAMNEYRARQANLAQKQTREERLAESQINLEGSRARLNERLPVSGTGSQPAASVQLLDTVKRSLRKDYPNAPDSVLTETALRLMGKGESKDPAMELIPALLIGLLGEDPGTIDEAMKKIRGDSAGRSMLDSALGQYKDKSISAPAPTGEAGGALPELPTDAKLLKPGQKYRTRDGRVVQYRPDRDPNKPFIVVE